MMEEEKQRRTERLGFRGVDVAGLHRRATDVLDMVEGRGELVHVGPAEPDDSVGFGWEHLGAKPSFDGLSLGVPKAIQRHVRFWYEGNLEPRWHADHVQRNNNVAGGQVTVGILCSEADNQDARELMFQRNVRHCSIAILDFGRTTRTYVGPDIGALVVHGAIGMGLRQLHTSERAIGVPGKTGQTFRHECC